MRRKQDKPTEDDGPEGQAEVQEETQPEGKPEGRKLSFPKVCWFFMGLGVYRAWIETGFVGSFVDYPAGYSCRYVFDGTCAVVLLVCALAARLVSPLYAKRPANLAAAAFMALAVVLGFVCLENPQLTNLLRVPAAVLGGAGVGIMILLWSELYGCLNPVRIALYYALSQLVGAGVIWTLKGFSLPWLAFYTCLLPFVSLFMLYRAYRTLPEERLPHAGAARFTFPWKTVALVCVYAFAFGLEEANIYAFAGPHSSLGMVVAALVVVVAIVFLGRWVEFGTLYSVWLPALMMVSLLVSLVGSPGRFGASFFSSLSYGAAEIFIMTMIGSICYRYGVNAVWIFGIERCVRMISMAVGRAVSPFASGWLLTAAVVAAAALGTWLIFSERGLSSNWGIVMYEEGEDLYRAAMRNAQGKRCAELGRQFGLTSREEEVLLLLADRKTASDIERELCVAYGTAKAHIRHVYKKLGIHSREELFGLVDPTGKPGGGR